MNDTQIEDESELGFILWLVWGALLFSIVIYALVPFGIPAPGDYSPPRLAQGEPPTIFVILGVAAVAVIPVVLRVRRRMFFEPFGTDCQPKSVEARSAYFNMSLTTWIVCELVAVFGFAVYFVTYEVAMMAPFLGLAALMLLAFRPKPDTPESPPD